MKNYSNLKNKRTDLALNNIKKSCKSTNNDQYNKSKKKKNLLTAAAKKVLSPISDSTVMARDLVKPYYKSTIKNQNNQKFNNSRSRN